MVWLRLRCSLHTHTHTHVSTVGAALHHSVVRLFVCVIVVAAACRWRSLWSRAERNGSGRPDLEQQHGDALPGFSLSAPPPPPRPAPLSLCVSPLWSYECVAHEWSRPCAGEPRSATTTGGRGRRKKKAGCSGGARRQRKEEERMDGREAPQRGDGTVVRWAGDESMVGWQAAVDQTACCVCSLALVVGVGWIVFVSRQEQSSPGEFR